MSSEPSQQERIVPMRVQKFLARAGVASRRGSENLMTAGRVRVNGQVVTELGSKVDPSVDVDALRLTPLAKAIAKAAQTYGFIVPDRGGAVAVMAEGVDVHRERTGEDPWAQMLSGVPSYEQLKGFPWERTQVIRRDWGRPG